MAVDEIDLRSLADKDLVEQMHADLYDGLKDEIERGSASCWGATGRRIER